MLRTSSHRPAPKGLKLPASDVLALARAVKAFYERGQSEWLDEYSSATTSSATDGPHLVCPQAGRDCSVGRRPGGRAGPDPGDTLRLQIAGESENYDVERKHLNNVFGARLRITALRAAKGPGIEFLEYLAPRDERPAPADLRANEIAHWQTTLVAKRLDALVGLARDHRLSLVSPGPVDGLPLSLGFRTGSLTRDPDGHGIRLVAR